MSDVPAVTAALLAQADQRLVRTVDGLTGDDLAAPSLLPGWTRAHVVAHLALNGEALERVLVGQRHGTPRTMYDTPEGRDRDIDDLAGADPTELRERLLAATTRFEQACAAMTQDDAAARFERTPGGQVMTVGSIPFMRLREVEIHHADLAAGYSPADWPATFCVALLDSMTRREYGEPFRLLARDLARTWQLGDGEGGPVVAGDAAALAWWLTGRGDGEGLDCDTGTLPAVAPW